MQEHTNLFRTFYSENTLQSKSEVRLLLLQNIALPGVLMGKEKHFMWFSKPRFEICRS